KRIAVLRSGRSEDRVKLLAQVRTRLEESLQRQAACFRDQLIPELAKHGVQLYKWESLTPAQRDEAARYFDAEISPALTPLVFDRTHGFPFLSNLSTSLAFVLQDPQKGTSSYARVKVPGVLKQWVSLSADVAAGQKAFVPLYEVIQGNIHKLYTGM